MAFKFSFKMILPIAVLTLSACSFNGQSRYGTGEVYGIYDANQAFGAYGDVFDYSLGAAPANLACASHPQGVSGLRGGYNAQGQVYKSRYGHVPEGLGCESGGYWVYPQPQYVAEYQLVQQHVVEPALPQPSPEPVPDPIVIEACPDGQYRASHGECVVTVVETPVYTPPIYEPPQSFPVSPSLPVISYQPIRK